MEKNKNCFAKSVTNNTGNEKKGFLNKVLNFRKHFGKLKSFAFFQAGKIKIVSRCLKLIVGEEKSEKLYKDKNTYLFVTFWCNQDLKKM